MAELTDDDRTMITEAVTDYYRSAKGALLMELNDPKRKYSPEVRECLEQAKKTLFKEPMRRTSTW